MYEACPLYGTEARFKWNGEDLADFISLSIYTGLRISDVALFRADRMQPSGEILIRTTKAGTHVYTWVTACEGVRKHPFNETEFLSQLKPVNAVIQDIEDVDIMVVTFGLLPDLLNAYGAKHEILAERGDGQRPQLLPVRQRRRALQEFGFLLNPWIP